MHQCGLTLVRLLHRLGYHGTCAAAAVHRLPGNWPQPPPKTLLRTHKRNQESTAYSRLATCHNVRDKQALAASKPSTARAGSFHLIFSGHLFIRDVCVPA